MEQIRWFQTIYPSDKIDIVVIAKRASEHNIETQWTLQGNLHLIGGRHQLIKFTRHHILDKEAKQLGMFAIKRRI